ncbi:MAG TPA: polyprenyl synthetase family protein [Candidatus Saccharimonadales bacterium]|nr:polyprenyl synthetase family protein [Candidatus Saccharimonadales bacterium]
MSQGDPSKQSGAQYDTYRAILEDDIAAYIAYIQTATRAQYGDDAALGSEAFLQVLAGGKRLRGVLTMAGYELCGGQNWAMIIQAARAIEMLHAYILIIDDIEDESPRRRGHPAAHVQLAGYHRRHHLKGRAAHTGLSVAVNAAIAGAHAAQVVLANLDADPYLRLSALSITNRTLAITAHGQTSEILLSARRKLPAEADLDRILEWKTALYSVTNPLHVGMVLAGADCHATDAITPFATHVGKVYQLQNDLEDIFGSSTADIPRAEDIRGGKLNLLIYYALQHALPADSALLQRSLGNPRLTASAIRRCRAIIQQSGAQSWVQQLIDTHIQKAQDSLRTAAQSNWSEAIVRFLYELADMCKPH